MEIGASEAVARDSADFAAPEMSCGPKSVFQSRTKTANKFRLRVLGVTGPDIKNGLRTLLAWGAIQAPASAGPSSSSGGCEIGAVGYTLQSDEDVS